MPNRYGVIGAPNAASDRWRDKLTRPMMLFDIAVLWYYSFSGSITLRPMVSAFWIVMAVLGLMVFHMERFPVSRYMLFGIISVLYMLATALLSSSVDASVKYALTMLLYLIIAVELTSNRENIFFFVNVLFWYTVVLMLIGYVQQLMPKVYEEVFLTLLPKDHQSQVLRFMEQETVTGFFNQTSRNALAMGLGTGLCVYKLLKSDKNKPLQRSAYVALLIAFMLQLLNTKKRGALVAVLLVLAYIIYTNRKNWMTKLMITFSSAAMVLFGGFRYIPGLDELMSKNEHYATGGDISNGRFEKWTVYLEMIWKKPLFGYGADSLRAVVEKSEANAHNSYLQITAELGLIGVIVFFLPFVYGLLEGHKRRRRIQTTERRKTAMLTFAMFWQLFGFIIAFFESTFSTENVVFMLFVTQLIMFRLTHEKTDVPTNTQQENTSKGWRGKVWA